MLAPWVKMTHSVWVDLYSRRPKIILRSVARDSPFFISWVVKSTASSGSMVDVEFPLGNAEVDVSCEATKVKPGDPDLSCDRSSFRRLWGGPSGSGFLPFPNVCYKN